MLVSEGQWSVTEQTTRRLVGDSSIDHLMDRTSLLEQKIFPVSSKDPGRVHQFSTKVRS